MRTSLLGRVGSLISGLLVTAAVIAALPGTALAVDPTFTIKGGGWGHGIGLSQYGSRGYALQGWSYDDIVTHYYQGTRLVSKPSVTVRVNLDANGNGRSAWWIKAGSDTTLTVTQISDTSVNKVLDATNSYWIVTSNGSTKVCKDSYDSATGRHSAGTVLKTFSGGCYASAGGLVQIVGTSGPFSHSGVRWRGTIRFLPLSSTSSSSKAVNYVSIEQYLYGVVPRESPSSWPAEALKAQAVAARSYAYQDAADGHTIYCTTRSQVYNGQGRTTERHETDATNAAVDATKGQVVWYGSETVPVKTYFSSCTGGRTASIQDVWTGATPKPYYTSVADADQASPYYTWTEGPYTATSIASLIRTKDANGEAGLQYSEPSPAKIVNITTERASSGYTHHVTTTWSNGATHRILGDTMRSALSMKSTKFGVTRTYPVVSKTRYEDSNSKLAYAGRWTSATSSTQSGSTMRYSATANSTMSASFNGTGLVWVGNKAAGYGKANVYVDGKYAATVDLYSSTTRYKQALYTRSNLSSGTHTFTVKVLGARNGASKGYTVAVDAIDIINGTLGQATSPITRFEQSNANAFTLGTWSTGSSTQLSGGSYLLTNEPAARFIATFYGSEVRWIGSSSTTYGGARVSVDGGAPVVVDLTTSTPVHQRVLFTKSGLSQASAHTIVIEAVGSTGAAGYTSVDAIDIRGGWLIPAVVPATTVQESSGGVAFKGPWSALSSGVLSGGSMRYSSTANASATVSFEGTGITWIGNRARSYGRANIYVDGAYKATVDLYASSSAYRQRLWTSGRLGTGRHTLVIKVLGAHNAAATGSTVAVDAFEVAGRAVTP